MSTSASPDLLGIPPELRLQIYEYLLVSTPIQFEGFFTPGDGVHQQPDIGRRSICKSVGLPCTSVLQLCRNIYKEAVPILYGNNTFQFSMFSEGPTEDHEKYPEDSHMTEVFPDWVCRIGPDNAHRLRHVHFVLHRPPHTCDHSSQLDILWLVVLRCWSSPKCKIDFSSSCGPSSPGNFRYPIYRNPQIMTNILEAACKLKDYLSPYSHVDMLHSFTISRLGNGGYIKCKVLNPRFIWTQPFRISGIAWANEFRQEYKILDDPSRGEFRETFSDLDLTEPPSDFHPSTPQEPSISFVKLPTTLTSLPPYVQSRIYQLALGIPKGIIIEPVNTDLHP